jgi:hypothetical protein
LAERRWRSKKSGAVSRCFKTVSNPVQRLAEFSGMCAS